MNIQYKDSIKITNYTRYTISFTVAENEYLPAYLYLPAGNRSYKYPAMLVLHSTGDLGKGIVDGQGKPDRAFAKELAERGYVVIAPDYPSFGDLKDYDFGNDRYESGTMKAIFNHIRCVDLLQNLDQVDPDRIGVIGHSLGGHNAMFVAAFDDRLKVVISSCGWTQFEYYDIGPSAEKLYGGRLGPWAQDRYMPLIRTKYQLDQNKIPFNFHEIIALIAPRIFISNSPLNDKNFNVRGVREGIRKVSVVYESLGVKENLKVFYPDSGHDFPLDIKNKIYQLIDRKLKYTPHK